MEHRAVIFDEFLARDEGYDVLMSLTATYDDSLPRFTFTFHGHERTENQTFTFLTEARITSSLDISTIAHIVGVFGVCVVGKVGRPLGKMIIDAYNSSKSDNPHYDFVERSKDIIERVTSKRSDITGEAVKAIVDCLPIPKP